MAAYYFGINNGQNEYDAVKDSSPVSKDVVIAISDITKVPSKEELFLAIEKLENFILRSNLWG